jgi:multidrug efflux pump subunit AcrA (membrane-fusion protein)
LYNKLERNTRLGDEGMKKKKKAMMGIIGMALIVFVIIMGLKSLNKTDNTFKFVKTDQIEIDNLESKVYTNGRIMPKDTREVVAELSGKVMKILVEEGNVVEQNEILAQMDDFDLQNQLKTAELKLGIEKDTLNKLVQESGQQYNSAAENAKINYKQMQSNYDEQKKLFEIGAISEKDLSDAKDKLDQCKNDYAAAQKKSNTGLNSEISIQKKQIESTELSIAKLKNEIEKTRIKAPIKGMVSDILTKEIDQIQAGEVAFIVEDVANLEVVTSINEYEVQKIGLNQPVEIQVEGLDKVYAGKITDIASAAKVVNLGQSKETSVEVKVSFDEETSDLKSNYSASLEILADHRDNAFTIPYEALKKDPDSGKLYMFMINENDVIAKKFVRRGLEGDLRVEVIAEELEEGMRVVVNPDAALADGDSVRYAN